MMIQYFHFRVTLNAYFWFSIELVVLCLLFLNFLSTYFLKIERIINAEFWLYGLIFILSYSFRDKHGFKQLLGCYRFCCLLLYYYFFLIEFLKGLFVPLKIFPNPKIFNKRSLCVRSSTFW